MSITVLGIETSCDETGVAVVRDGELLADVTATSMDEYARYGGIIPEIASRAHLQTFVPTLDEALDRAGVALGDVDAIAVTAGPGLIGSLTVGVSAAKALALAAGKPLYGVNHIVGHLCVDELVDAQMADDVVDAVEGLARGESQGLGCGNADRQRSDQARARGDGDRVDVAQRNSRTVERLVQGGNEGLKMRPRGDFGNDAAVTRVFVHRRRGDVGKELPVADDGDSRLVAGSLNAQNRNAHVPQV